MKELAPATFAEGADVLDALVAAQGALLAELARHMVKSNEPPALDLDAMRERVGIVAHFARLLRALEPDEREVREIARRRAEWIAIVDGVAAAEAKAVEAHVLFNAVISEPEPDSEFGAIAQALRDVARNERNNLPALARRLPASAGALAALNQLRRRAAWVDRAAVYFHELIPKERETLALMPGAPSPALSKEQVE